MKIKKKCFLKILAFDNTGEILKKFRNKYEKISKKFGRTAENTWLLFAKIF